MFVFNGSVKGMRMTMAANLVSQYFAYPTDTAHPTVYKGLRLRNLDATNPVWVLSGTDPAGTPPGTAADNTCHYLPPGGTFVELVKKDADTGINLITTGGTPSVQLEFGTIREPD